ncbi:MAG: hypothetical protein Q8K46_00370, partial [Deltaproteobacteria bacterium]|nr:hypothetical protein [Deltaproteobacteria bacterium]
NLLVIVLVTLFSVGMYMAIKVFMITLELGLIVMLAPLSFSFLGMNALKDQGIAPFKALISLAYRIILMGIIYSAFSKVSSVSAEYLHDIVWYNPLKWPYAINVIMSMLCAFPMIAFLLYKSDSIASSLASGGTSMGGGDVAAAAAAGAAAGAAVGSGSAAVGNAPKAMSEVLSGMMNSGTVKDATQGMGTGGMNPVDLKSPAVREPSPSLGPTNSHGAPIRPTTDAKSSSGGAKEQSPATSTSGASSPKDSTGSGQNAGIGGAGSKMEENLGKLVDHLSNQKPNEKTFGDHLSNVNQHVANESTTTHVQISTQGD